MVRSLLSGRFRRDASGRCKEIDARDFIQPFSSPGEAGGAVDAGRGAAELTGKLPIIGVPLGPRSPHELLVDLPIHEARLTDPGLSVSRPRFLRDPLEVFQAVFPARQDVDRALQSDCSDPGQPLTDLRPQVERPGRELMDQHVPRETGDPGHKYDSSNSHN